MSSDRSRRLKCVPRFHMEECRRGNASDPTTHAKLDVPPLPWPRSVQPLLGRPWQLSWKIQAPNRKRRRSYCRIGISIQKYILYVLQQNIVSLRASKCQRRLRRVLLHDHVACMHLSTRIVVQCKYASVRERTFCVLHKNLKYTTFASTIHSNLLKRTIREEPQ